MSKRLDGKIALVVGAGSSAPGMGNGKATAIAFAREGATVVCTDVNEAAAKETERLILDEGGRARHLAFDVTDSTAVAAPSPASSRNSAGSTSSTTTSASPRWAASWNWTNPSGTGSTPSTSRARS